MKIVDLNASGAIGSNSMYLELGPFQLVVDAGIHPKLTGREALPTFEKIPTKRLDAIILTHCHLEHVGAIPVLSRLFPNSPILSTVPSALLGPRMMHNSVSVMMLQRDELGISEYPLYTRAEVEKVAKRFWESPFNRTRVLERAGEELRVTLTPAGHVAGAASVLLEYKHRKIFITGDISFNDQWTIPGARLPEGHVDTLIMETTRGNNARSATREDETQRFLTAVNDTLKQGGSVLIPVFALGRMQEMLMLLAAARKANELVPSPIYCTGLGVDLCDYFDELHRKTGLIRFSRKAVAHLRAQAMPEFVHPRQGGVKKKGIYLVSSGMMMEKTPSYAVAASLFEDPASSLLFVGYCAPETPGNDILQLKKGDSYFFKALDHQAQLKARVERFDLSGHADREELVKMAEQFAPRSIVLTHGDPEARQYFQERLKAQGGVLNPTPLMSYEV